MFAYDDLVQWCKDMRSAQIARRNRAWNFQHAHGIDPCDVAWNADAIRWVDGMVYVVSRNVKRNGELGTRELAECTDSPSPRLGRASMRLSRRAS